MPKAAIRRVLVIEDDEFLSRLLGDKLTAKGFLVTRAATGQDGLAAVKTPPLPEIVLLDLILPGVDGFEVLRQIRQDRNAALARLPVIVLSNLGGESDIDRARQLGANDYWVKAHLSPAEIAAKLNDFFSAPAAPPPR